MGFIQIGGVAGAGDTLSDGGLVQTSAEYSERVKVGHNSGSPTCSRRRYLVYEKGMVRKSCISFSSWRQVCHTKLWPSGVPPKRASKMSPENLLLKEEIQLFQLLLSQLSTLVLSTPA